MDSRGTASWMPQLAARTGFKPTRQYAAIAGILLLLTSVALNVVLARRVRTFRNEKSMEPRPLLLKAGATVPPITARGADGKIESLTYSSSDRPTVVYVFTPACIWCERNLDNLRTLIRMRGREYRFVGLSLSPEGLAQYLTDQKLELPTYTRPSEELLKAYRFHGTPQTIVVSPQGRVIQNWVGAYSDYQKSQVEAFFHVTLPGIQPPHNSK